MRKTVLKTVSALMIILLLTGCNSGVLKGLKKEDDNYFVSPKTKYEHLAKLTSEKARQTGFSGSMIIATDEDIIMFCGPKTKTVDGKDKDPYTTYEIGSITKTFTAALTLKLIEQGKLSMDDKVTKFFPECTVAENITIADLLHMQSGLPDYANSPSIRSYLGTMMEDDTMTDEIFLKCLNDHNLSFEPKTNTEYSNTNFHLLAMIIEQVEGESYDKVLKRVILDPCGIKHTSSMTTGDVTSIAGAIGYHPFQKGAGGAGDIHSCAADMIAFDRALFGGKLLSEESMALMKDFRGTFYGCGLMFIDENVYGHSGSTPAYISQNMIFETEEYGNVYFFASISLNDGMQGMGEVSEILAKELT